MAFYATTEVKDEKRYYPVFRCDKSENRMVSASNGSAVVTYNYDYMGRRFQKVVNGVTNNFIYDGWAMIQETSSAGVTNTYVYGLDLSGTIQGAGTIGGILSASFNGTNAFFCYDGNGNVTDLVDSNGNSLAHYEYSPFGQEIASSGSLADVNPFRFSTKYYDAETGLNYYGFRYYDPYTGRWLSRDPIEEDGGLNQYVFCGDCPVNFVDPWGLIVIFVHGTYSGPGAFDAGTRAGFGNTFNDSNLVDFEWTGHNNIGARRDAGQILAGTIARIRRQNPGETITVVAHSHGGNVALEATQHGATIDALVTLGTPSRFEHSARPGSVATWYNLYSESDAVQGNGGGAFGPLNQDVGPAGRWFPGAINIELPIDEGGIQTHSLMRGSASYRAIRAHMCENEK